MDFRRLLIALLLLAEEAVPDVFDNRVEAAAPPEVCFRVKAVYNNAFRDYVMDGDMSPIVWGFSSAFTIDEAIRRIFDLANSYFQCEKLPSAANVRVHLIPDIVHDGNATANEWYADVKKTFKSMRHHLHHWKPGVIVDHMTFLTYDKADSSRIIGVSAGRWMCSNSVPPMWIRQYSVVELQQTAYRTAQLLVHELAHALGIKTDRSGCEGFMGAKFGGRGWSGCNVADLKSALANAPIKCPKSRSYACPSATMTYKCPPVISKPLEPFLQDREADD